MSIPLVPSSKSSDFSHFPLGLPSTPVALQGRAPWRVSSGALGSIPASRDTEHLWEGRTTIHTWSIPSKCQNVKQNSFPWFLLGKMSWECSTSLPVSFSSQPCCRSHLGFADERKKEGEETQTDLLTEYLLK